MKKNAVVGKGLFLLSLLVFSGCQAPAKPANPTKETTTMTTEQNHQTKSSESLEIQITSTSQSNPVFPEGALIQAVTNKDLSRVEAILKDQTYAIDEVNAQAETPLLIATHQNLVEIAKKLIDAGADINQQDQISDSPYLYAGAQGKTAILAYMLEKQVPDQQKFNRFGGNALIPAAEKGHLDNVVLLLKDGRSNINHQNNYGYTALIEAVALKDGSPIYQEIVKTLLAAGADKSLRDNTGRNAADYAASLGYTEILALLNAY